MGLEPTTLGTTNQYSNQLSYNHRVFSTLQKYDLKHFIQIFLNFALQFLLTIYISVGLLSILGQNGYRRLHLTLKKLDLSAYDRNLY
jgi:hypothetical protein